MNVVIRARPHSAVKFQQIYILFLTGPVPTGECANFKSFVKYGKMHKLWLTLDTSLRLRFRFWKCRDLSDLQLMDRGHCLLGVIQSSSSELVKCNVCYVKLVRFVTPCSRPSNLKQDKDSGKQFEKVEGMTAL